MRSRGTHVLRLLRDDLRKELGISAVEGTPDIFRLERHLDSGNWKGEVVPRTDPVLAGKDP
jgi:hypothetical protein